MLRGFFMSVDAGVAFEIITVLKQEAEHRLIKGIGILVGNEVIAGDYGKLGIGFTLVSKASSPRGKSDVDNIGVCVS